MNKYISKYKDTYILSVVLISGTIFYWFDIITDKELLGIIISSGTIYFGLLKYRIENDRVFRELFDSFNERYTSGFNSLIMDIRESKKEELNEADLNLVIDYFNLCAEEYLWYERGRIPYMVWKSWRSGILVNLEIHQLRSIYNSEMKTENGKKSYYGLEKELRSFLK